MTVHRSLRSKELALSLMVIMLFGCASTTPTRHYLLGSIPGSERVENPGKGPCVSIGLGPIKIPEYLNRLGIVTRLTPHELAVAEFNKWAEPLEESFPRILAEDLLSLLCTKNVVIFPWKGPISVDYRVYVDVIRMDGQLGESALLEVSWILLDGTNTKKVPVSKRSTYREATKSPDYEAFVSAQRRNLRALSRDIAEAIKILSQKDSSP